MKKFIAGKDAVVELKKTVEEQRRLTGQEHGVTAVFGGQNFTMKEIRWAEPNTVAFQHVADPGEPNTIVISAGLEFSAKVTPSHRTDFSGI